MTLLVGGLIVASVFLINYLRKEEIKRVNLVANALKYMQSEISPPPEVLDLVLQINETNATIPVIIMDKSGSIYEHRNIPVQYDNEEKIRIFAKEMAQKYEPIELQLPDGNNQFVYYDNSPLLNYLQYSPYILGLLILLYFLFMYWFLRTIKKTDEGFLWAGLAKETAHQIGTPLSSMIGWLEIMKMENENSPGIVEIGNDIERLKTISERFSKIGSVSELNDMNLTETVQENYDYLKNRISNKVEFRFYSPQKEILLPHNRILMSWVIENLVKNAVDAMKGCGKLDISLYEKNKNILIDFKDTGSGISKRLTRNIFKPGYSTKKRGWGLGLSLAKRVIKEYHKGDIKIAQTELGKGTTFRIVLKKL